MASPCTYIFVKLSLITYRSCGNSGRWQQNLERDMHRLSRKQLGLECRLFSVDVPIKQKTCDAPESGQHDLLLPHEVLGSLWRANESMFCDILGTARAEEYWTMTKAAGQHWYLQHPSRAEIESSGGRYHIPGRLFGDEGAVGKTRKILQVHWTSVLSTQMTRKTRFPILVLPADKSLGISSETPLYEAIVWSWECARRGVYPDKDPYI